jgi:hypothetical protein
MLPLKFVVPLCSESNFKDSYKSRIVYKILRKSKVKIEHHTLISMPNQHNIVG